VNWNQISVEHLKARRREAVRFWLQGQKLAAAAGLSAQSVIVAVLSGLLSAE